MAYVVVDRGALAAVLDSLSHSYQPPELTSAIAALTTALAVPVVRWDFVQTGLGPSMRPKTNGRFVLVEGDVPC